ncbi:MAG TPA: VCBS repeat-containing protein, partial [Terriglobales bacterium]|nr:VCBS repeat-containing protein [Terriglobales bacterium]
MRAPNLPVRQTPNLSRRDLLKLFGASLLVNPFEQVSRAGANQVTFTDVTRASGIDFKHDNAASPEKYLIETMGAGCGWIDYDQNGLLDLYLVNSAATPIYKPPHPLRSALYRNNGDGSFTDVTTRAGVGAEGLFGMGVAVGDYDNDGFPDLFICGYGRSILYH